MKAETLEYLAKARRSLQAAAHARTGGFADQAGRNAYSAGHQAAVGFIYERIGRVVKTHGGAHSEFARLIKDDQRFGPIERNFLGRGFELKRAANYATGAAAIVSDAEADRAIAHATALLDTIEAVLQETTEEPPP